MKSPLAVSLSVVCAMFFAGVANADHQSRVQKTIGGSTQANGHTSNANLGTAIVGFSLTNSNYGLASTGTQGVGFTKTASGDVSVSPPGSGSLGVGAFQPLTFTVNTASAGSKAGSVTVDNTAFFGDGCSDCGSNDPNEVFNFTATVLDPSNASFDSGSDSNSLLIDFGEVNRNDAASIGFDIHNLLATAGFTAGLDYISQSGTGDTSKLTTDVSTFSNSLAAGSAQSFTASLDTSETGVFSATYTFFFGDDASVQGATNSQSPLTLTLRAIVTPEPASVMIWSALGIAGVVGGRRRLRRKSKKA